MSEAKVKAIQYGVDHVGKHIKATKKQYFWALSIAGRYLQLLLQDSLVTGKKKLSINGKSFFQTQTQMINKLVFLHQFLVDGVHFSITELDNTYQLRINNIAFSHLLNQELKKDHFEQEKGDQNGFELNQKLKSQQKIKVNLNLPGMGNGMKKKKIGTAKSDNWDDFVGGGSSFPNYFGDNFNLNQESCLKQTASNEKKYIIPQQQQKIVSEQFSTMQNLFKTTIGETPCNTKKAQTIIQPTTTTAAVYSFNDIPTVNQSQFNTMRNLFTTNANLQQFSCSNIPPIESKSNNNINKVIPPAQNQNLNNNTKIDEFNTMMQMFSTLKVQSKNPPLPPPNQEKINLNDFNTMQIMFKTNAFQFDLPQKQTKPETSTNKTSQQQQFTTVQQTIPITPAIQFSNIPLNKINMNDFNTMQNLFNTNNFNLSEMMNPLASTSKHNKTEVQTVSDKTIDSGSQQPNANDFNTMQNLFKTGFNVNMSNDKKQNQFWKF